MNLSPIPRAVAPMTVAAALAKLEDFDFGDVREYVVRKGIYSADKVDEVEREYKRFIALLVGTGEAHIMTRPVDDYWHSHLLFTKSYKQMAGDLLVRGIDHMPTKSEEERLALLGDYNRTHVAYEKHFGTPPVEYWYENGQICAGEGESIGAICNALADVQYPWID